MNIKTGFRQSGVTLIEILITLLVLAIGLLGLAALQGGALQSGQSSLYRTQATNLSYEITDYVRAHRSRLVDGVFGIDVIENLFQNRLNNAYQIPGGTVDLELDNGTELTITVSWLEDRIDQNAAGATSDFEFITRI